MASVFGIILQIRGKEGILIFLLVLLVLILLEYFFKVIDKLSARHGYEGVVEKLKKELSVLGIISFSVFIYQAIAQDNKSAYFEAFEFAHIIALFMAIAFIIQALILIRYAVIGGKDLLTATRLSFHELEESYNELDPKYQSYSRFAFHYFPSWLPWYPKFRTYIEYRIIEKFFLEQHPLPKGFKFSKYATVLFKKYIAELGEVTPLSWMLVGVLVVINFIRVAIIDDHLKQNICGSNHHESSSEEHHVDHFEESLKYGCVEYILPYGLICVGILFIFILSIYFASGYYYDRLLYKCMQWDGIDVKHKRGKHGYKQFLQNSEVHELLYKKLTQQSLLEFTGHEPNSIMQRRSSISQSVRRSSYHMYGSPERRESILDAKASLQASYISIKPKQMDISYHHHDHDQHHNDDHHDDHQYEQQHHISPVKNRRQSYSQIIDAYKGQHPDNQYRSVHHLTDLYEHAGEEIMTIDEYKLEIDYMKAKAEHDEEVLLNAPMMERWMHFFQSIFQSHTKHHLPSSASSHKRKATSTKQQRPSSFHPQGNSNNNHNHRGVEGYEHYPEQASIVPTLKERIISELFLFQSPKFHFALVDISLLFQCFYISIWATQLMPLAIHSRYEIFYIIILTVPILLNGYLVETILHQTVMLQCVEGLHTEVVDIVCDESIQEAKVLLNIRRAIRERCEAQDPNQSTWHHIIRTQFNKFDTDNNGMMDSTEFRHFLGTLDIFMSKARFDIAWEAIDYDLSGAITWDELFILVFPEYQFDMQEEMKLLDDFRETMKMKLVQDNIAKHKWRGYLYSLFQQVDADKSGYIEKAELTSLLTILHVDEYDDRQMNMLFQAIDGDCDEKISYQDLCSILHLQVESVRDSMVEPNYGLSSSQPSNNGIISTIQRVVGVLRRSTVSDGSFKKTSSTDMLSTADPPVGMTEMTSSSATHDKDKDRVALSVPSLSSSGIFMRIVDDSPVNVVGDII